jgi:hypothetical protein
LPGSTPADLCSTRALRGELVLARSKPVAMKWQRHGPHLGKQAFAVQLTALASAMCFMASDISHFA